MDAVDGRRNPLHPLARQIPKASVNASVGLLDADFIGDSRFFGGEVAIIAGRLWRLGG